MRLSATAQNASTNARTVLVDGGSLVLLDGARSLVVLALASTAFGPAREGEALANGRDGRPVGVGNPLTATATGDGICRRLEARGSGGAVMWEGAVGRRGTRRPDGSPWDLELDNDSLRAGQEFKLTLWTHAQPAGSP